MQPPKTRIAEILFFVFYFFVLQFLSDLQYYFEFGDNLSNTLLYRLVVTPLSLLPYIFFYKRLVPLLLLKKYGRFALVAMLFLCFKEIFLHLLDWLIWQMPILDAGSRLRAKNNWMHPRFPRQSLWLTCMNLVAITGFAFMVNRWRQEYLLRNLKEQHLALELNYLKAQLHPHFFFNTLNNIYSLALYKSDKTAPVVAQLSELMRYIIYEGSKPTVRLQQEINFLNSYVQLEQIRHEEQVPIRFVCKGDANGLSIPPLLLMPLLENAFKHGFGNIQEDGWVEAVLVIHNKALRFEVSNSKAETHNSAENGIGLQNLKKQLLLLYPERHVLQITNSKNRFSVYLTLHLS